MVTRRDFLKQAALLAGGAIVAPTILPRSAFGKGAPSNRINVAMIGCGRQTVLVNTKQMLASENAQIVAVCDIDRWRLEKSVQQVNEGYAAQKGFAYKGCDAYTDYRELLQQRGIDAVMISTPDHWHVPMAIDAARAGKHISLEKPISTCIAHGKRLVETLKKYPVITRNDSEFRTIPEMGRVVELVRSGRIGRITRIDVAVPPELNGLALDPQPTMPVPEELDYDMWLGPAWEAPYTEKRVHARQAYGRPGWMRVDSYCNGMISNWGAHLMGIVQWGNNSEYTGPATVEGNGDFDKGLWNTLNRFDIHYTYANGTDLYFRIERPYVRFTGTDGWIEIEYPDKVTASSPDILNTPPSGDSAYTNLPSDKEDFLLAIKAGKQTLEPLETAHRTISMCQLGLIAVKLGAPLKWDPVAEDFIGDNAASAMLDVPIREKYFRF